MRVKAGNTTTQDVLELDFGSAATLVERDGKAVVGSLAGSGVPPGGTTNQVLTKTSNADGDATWQNPVGSGGTSTQTFGQPGVLSTGLGAVPFVFPFAATINGVVAAVGTAPTGAAVIVDVNLNGVTIFSTQANRPTIAAGETKTTSMPAPDVTGVAQFDVLTVDIDQIGSTIAGSDLIVVISYNSA